MSGHLDPLAGVRSTFDAWARDGRAEGMEDSHRDIVLQMLDRAGIQPHHHVLDLGCGSGWTVRLLAALVPQGRAYGADVSEEMIRCAQAAANPAHVAFTAACASDLPYASASLHRVVSMESLYYWPDLPAGFREVARVLVPGGRFLAALEYFRENPFTRHWGEFMQLPLQLHGAAAYEAMLRESGFADVASERLRDRRPPRSREEFHSGAAFPDYETYLDYRRAGALLVTAAKAGAEPAPGRAPAADPPAADDPGPERGFPV